jgi:hypothetical protein
MTANGNVVDGRPHMVADEPAIQETLPEVAEAIAIAPQPRAT